ncbi:hypothetical protein [Akkermansia sp.]|uniref:hypothetical protein n=1 Tax=Akkermansia sp. TaxID=1872421 RepID=UPI0025C4A701|nr:hypothetical protein [Akkermansia sp.]MCC8149642.1 hypothetical protein [Akkermansia sp.]
MSDNESRRQTGNKYTSGLFYNLVAQPSGKNKTGHGVFPLTTLFQDQNNPSGDIIPHKKQPFSPTSNPISPEKRQRPQQLRRLKNLPANL